MCASLRTNLIAMVLAVACLSCATSIRVQPATTAARPEPPALAEDLGASPDELGLDRPPPGQSVEAWTDGWSEGPVSVIATEEEREIFAALDSADARADFIRTFWARRDPDPTTDANPYLDAFAARVGAAEAMYPTGEPEAWTTLFGVVLLAYGPADAVKTNADGSRIVWTYSRYLLSWRQGRGRGGSYDLEQWWARGFRLPEPAREGDDGYPAWLVFDPATETWAPWNALWFVPVDDSGAPAQDRRAPVTNFVFTHRDNRWNLGCHDSPGPARAPGAAIGGGTFPEEGAWIEGRDEPGGGLTCAPLLHWQQDAIAEEIRRTLIGPVAYDGTR